MPYSTQMDVQIAVGGSAKLIELSDLESLGAIDSDVVAKAILDADALIDSYIGQRMKLPLATTPAVISGLSASMAARNLRRGRYNGLVPDQDKLDDEADRKWLDGVSKGTITLGIDPEPAAASKIIDKAAPRDSTLAVSRERMKDFI